MKSRRAGRGGRSRSFWKSGRSGRRRRACPHLRRLTVELLEDRRLLDGGGESDPFIVDSLVDESDGDYSEGDLSLREAIELAGDEAIHPGSDTIRFHPDLFLAGPQTITLGGSQLTIDTDMRIEGPGSDVLTISGGGRSRVFRIIGAETNVDIVGLTLSDGYSTSGAGGAIENAGGVLTLDRCEVTGNSAGGGIWGGGIGNLGTLYMTDSIISNNFSNGRGGGIHTQGPATIVNSLIAGNQSDTGGGISAWFDGDLTIVNSTISRNTAKTGGGIAMIGTRFSMNNTILADNAAVTAVDFYGTGVSHNPSIAIESFNNLIGNGNTLWDAGSAALNPTALVDGVDGNIVGTGDAPIDPLLSDWIAMPDGRRGMLLLPGSPAIDAGDNTKALDADGNPLTGDLSNSPRIGNGTVDIGATETTAVFTAGVSYEVDSLDMAIAADGLLSFGEAVEAAVTNEPVGDAPAGSATDRDVIAFAEGLEGTIMLEGQQIIIDGRLSITGPGVDLLSFDGESLTRGFIVNPAGRAEILGITIQGSGIANYGILKLEQAIVTDCHGRDGSALWNSGYASIIDSEFMNNSGNYGGAVNSAGTLHISNSNFHDNSADQGGALFTTGELILVASTVSGNHAASWGGGIYSGGDVGATAIVDIRQSVITYNSAGSNDGGGIHVNRTALNVSNTLIASNSAGYNGNGGGINAWNMGFTVTNSTIVYNSAVTNGGIWGSGELKNSIVAGNYGAGSSPDVGGPLSASSANNLIGNGDGSVFSDGVDGNIVGTADAPIDPMLSDFMTLPDGREVLLLLPGSPALDAGDNALAVDPDGIPFVDDLIGNPRIENGTVDIGCVEGAAAGAPGVEYVVQSLDSTLANDGILSFYEAFLAAESNQAVHDAPAGSATDRDLITFADGLSGTFSLAGEPLEIRGRLEIRGPDAASLVLDAGGTGRVLKIHGSGDALISGVSIARGRTSGSNAGGIANDGTLTLDNTIIRDHSAARSGGAISNNGRLSISNSEIHDNSAGENGGAITNGGAGYVLVANSNLWNNSTRDFGGAFDSSGVLVIQGSTISDNYAHGYGGGIADFGSRLEITDSKFIGNTAGSDNGGALCLGGASATIVNTLILLNVSNGGDGGGVYAWRGHATFINSTIAYNDASVADGIFKGTGGITLQNTVVAKNGPDGNGIDIYGNVGGSYNLIGDGSYAPTLLNGENGNLVGTLLSPIDPLFVRNPSDGGDGWGDNPATPNVDESANDDYGDLRLRPDSPAVDAGNTALAVAPDASPLEFDIRGEGFPRVRDAVVDIGAYEFQPFSDLDGSGRIDDADLNIMLSSLGEVGGPADFTGDGIVNEHDLSILVAWFGSEALVEEPEAMFAPEDDATGAASPAPFGPVENPAQTPGISDGSLPAMPIGPMPYATAETPPAARSLLSNSPAFVGPTLPQSRDDSKPLIRPTRSSQASGRIDETSMIALRPAYVDATFARTAARRHTVSRARHWFLDESLWEDDLALRNARHRSTNIQ